VRRLHFGQLNCADLGALRVFHDSPSIAHTEHAAQFAQNNPPTMSAGEVRPGRREDGSSTRVTVVLQVFTIEPIVVAAPDYELFQLDDKWTIGIVGEAKCAMFEHSVMVHESGCHVLTGDSPTRS
jgi:hypothetical protein